MFKSHKSTSRLVLAGALFTAAAIVYGISEPIPATPIDDEPYRASPPLAITGFDVSDGTQTVFQTWFDPTPTTWRGELTAYPVDQNGNVQLDLRKWRASEQLTAQNIDAALSTDPKNCKNGYWKIDSRRIVTRNSTVDPTAAMGNQIAFRTTTVTGSLRNLIDGNSGTADRIVNWVRGDPTNEKQILEANESLPSSEWAVTNPCSSSSGTLRGRVNILGDIVNGKPLYVGAPAANYSFDGYPTFKSARSAKGATPRAGRVYVGANDGMLHAFDAATGNEVWAYIPSMLIPKLKALTSTATPYVHNYYVDGGITVGDAFIAPGGAGARSWRTVIVGGLGAGGKGLYALDVTDATAATEATEDLVKAKILWEISPTTRTNPGTAIATTYQDVGLGYTYPEPAITKLKDGRWVAVVGNGYNNDGNFKSTLLVIDLADGSLIRAIAVGSGTTGNRGGLSSPRVFDADSDGIVDFVYAGDVDGKLWKFDISSSTPSAWATPTAPLYTPDTGNNDTYAITGTPDVVIHPSGGFMVYFATGSLWTKNSGQSSVDKIANAQNYVIGVWDGAPAANTSYLQQTLVKGKYGGSATRPEAYDYTEVLVTDTTNGVNNVINWSTHKGWKTALPAGMHVTTAGFVRDHRYHITAYAPETLGNGNGNNKAVKPNESWLVELDYLVGSNNNSLVFDMNGDGALTDNIDRATNATGSPIAGLSGIPVGLFLGRGLFSQPLLALVSREFGVTLFNENILPVPGTPGSPPTCVANCGTQGSGISGGHFDYDVFNDAVAGSVKHTHQYDDKYDVVGASMTNSSDPTYNLGKYITPGTKFFVLISNGDLSPGVTFTVNQTKIHQAFEYPNKAILEDIVARGEASSHVYTWDAQPPACPKGAAGCVKTFQWQMPVDGLTAKDWKQPTPLNQSRPGLIPTQTGCVKSGTTANPGLYGENNNGALTIWIVKYETNTLIVANTPEARKAVYGAYDPTVTNGAIVYNIPESKVPSTFAGKTLTAEEKATFREGKGYKVNPSNKTLHIAHYTVFWHANSGCYGDSKYNSAPTPEDSNAGGGTHPPGTDDPTGVAGGGGAQKQVDKTKCPSGACVEHQYTATYDGKKDKSETRVTTTYYTDGSKLITREVLDKKGKVTSTTTETVAAPPVMGGGQTGSAPTVKSGSQVVTSQQELRNSGKLGRVSWHELISQ